MASLIDPLEPQDGDTVTADTRANFSAAHDEIEALQTEDTNLQGQINGKEPANANIQTHIANVTTNPHQVDKGNVGLGDVDNTSDADKPISDDTATALGLKVTGAASSTTNDFAAFADTTGHRVINSGLNAASFDAAGSADDVQTNLNNHEDHDNQHMTTDERLAMDAANAPDALNPFITQDDFVSGGGHAIKQDSGTAFTQRANLNFVGAVVSDDSGNNQTTVTITGGGGGEANTSSNDGAGAGLAKTKDGLDLPFKSIIGGTDINITTQTDTITINSEAESLPVGGATGDALVKSSATNFDAEWQPRLSEVSQDTTPQLGGPLDPNGNAIGVGGVNEVDGTINVTNTGGSPSVTVHNTESGDVAGVYVEHSTGLQGLGLEFDQTFARSQIVNTASHPLRIDGIDWPISDGSANQFMQTDGAGALGFAGAVGNDDTEAGASSVVNCVFMGQQDYDGLGTKVATTLYIINGA